MKSKNRKPAKAVTLLTKIETLLSDVFDELSAIEKSAEKNVRALLVSAESSITKAKNFISFSPAPEVRRTAAGSRQRRVKAKARPAARAVKRSAAAAGR